MAFTDDELADVREWLPWETDDVVLDSVHDRHLAAGAGSVDARWRTIIGRLRLRKQQWLSDPTVFGIGGGEYSQNVTKNVEALERDIAAAGEAWLVERSGGTGGVPRGMLVRYDPVRAVPCRPASSRRADSPT
jgi:hypothetical protein